MAAEDEEKVEYLDDDGALIQHEVIVRVVIEKDGAQNFSIRFAPVGQDDPPLITVLGMLEMAKDTAYRVYSEGTSDD